MSNGQKRAKSRSNDATRDQVNSPHLETAKQLVAARKQLGWSQEDFAEMAGISVGTVKTAEGGRPISCKTHTMIKDALNLGRSKASPPQAPLALPFPGTESVNTPAVQALPASAPNHDGHPANGHAGNPCLSAIREAIAEYAVPDAAHRLRLGYIRSPAELEALWAIDNSAYGEASISLDQFRGMWQAFKLGLHVLYFEQQIIGAMGIWPLSARCTETLKEGKMRERDLTGASMRAFAKRPAKTWYISGIVLKEELVGGRAIRVLLPAVLCSWLKVPIQYPCELLALASSPQGEALLNRFGFFRIQNAAAMPDNFPLYGLEISSREDFVTRMHQRGLDVD